jgi:O-antigen ligase
MVLGLLLVELQLLPWPAGLVRAVSPRAFQAHSSAQELTGVALSFRPSLYPHGTFNALIRFGSYVALFAAVCRLVVGRRDLGRLAGWILAAGFAASLLGIAQKLSGTNALYWWRQPQTGGSAFGPFVSRNQFAAYAVICLFAGVGLLVARMGDRIGNEAEGEDARSWLSGLREGLERRTSQNLLLVFALALIAAAVLWSLSRGGVLTMMLAGGAVLALMALSRAGGFKLYIVAGLVLMVAWVAFLGWEPVMARLNTLVDVGDTEASVNWRLTMFGDATRMGTEAPLLGLGAGTFHSVYPLWRTLPTYMSSRSPHNEYLHVFVETGVPGVLLLGLAVVIFGITVVRGLRHPAGPWTRGFLVGALGAVIAPALHGLFDFPLRSPAIAATLAVMLALLVRAAHLEHESPQEGGAVAGEKAAGRSARGARSTRRRLRRRKTVHHSFEQRRASGRRGIVAAAAIGLMAVVLGWVLVCNLALDPLRGELLGRRVDRVREHVSAAPGSVDVQAVLDSVEATAVRTVPEHAGLYGRMAYLAREGSIAALRDGRRSEAHEMALRALQLRKLAVRLDPLNRIHTRELAEEYLRFGRYDLAAKCAERLFKLVPRDPWTWADTAEDFSRYGDYSRARAYLVRAEQLVDRFDLKTARPELERVREEILEDMQGARRAGSQRGGRP